MDHFSEFQISIDTEKAPGTTSIAGPSTIGNVCKDILTASFFFYSPNLIWFMIAVIAWAIVPYDIGNSISELAINRLAINCGLVFGFFGFWHLSLYYFDKGERPFVANRQYSWTKVLHNIHYTFLGALQWTVTEVAFLYCYQTGRLQYIPNICASPEAIVITIAWSLLVPIIRDFHFYFVHRLIHTHFLYKYIHAVHHRNSDVEPFAGLAMHPAEHLYYFLCYGPLLIAKTSPFILLWMGTHVILSPAASHSGYEDHWCSDLYHYLHHRYYKCNYAGGGIPFDKWFGTFRDKLKVDGSAEPPKDPKSSLAGVLDHPEFLLLVTIIMAITMVMFNKSAISANHFAICVSCAPILAAGLLHLLLQSHKHVLAPFQNDSLSSLTCHMVAGFGMGVVPVSYLLELVVTAPK
jgi:sterol desaturase/sphingolipid hydroxylase (fatty acid hydroxylase superfamily)